MLIVGKNGFAKQGLKILYQFNQTENEEKDYFKKSKNQFTIANGNLKLRRQFFEKFSNTINQIALTRNLKTEIYNFDKKIEFGCNIINGTVLNKVNISSILIVTKGMLENPFLIKIPVKVISTLQD